MTRLRTLCIGDLGRIVTGKTPPSALPALLGKEFPFITPTDIDGQSRHVESARFLSPEGRAFQASLLLPPRAVCVVCIGATIGKVCMTTRPSFTNQQINSIVVEEAQHDPFYVYYLLTTLRDELRANAGGAATPIINKTAFSQIQVRVLPLASQQRAAAILAAYDDLIENNLRRIKILEEMARALYREWFVDFRFPGHEKIKLVDSSLGKIPQGWEVRRVCNCFTTVLGGTPSRAKPEFWKNGTIPWINSGKVNELRVTEPAEFITELALKRSAAKLMPKHTTVLAITGATLGQVSYLEIETAANQSVVGIIDSSGLRCQWLYLTICDRIEAIIKHASGGAQQHINKEIVDQIQLALPPRSLAEDFQRIVDPVFRQVATLVFQNTNLRRARDLLLPRLVSGQIDLSEVSKREQLAA